MTQAFNLSQLANNVNTAGQLNASTGLSSTVPVANGGTGTSSTTFCNLSTNTTGTLPISKGGTGQTTASSALSALGGLQGNTAQLCKAWVIFDGTSGAIRSQYNVQSVTRNAFGEYFLAFTSSLGTTNYSVTVSAGLEPISNFPLTSVGLFADRNNGTIAPTATGFNFFTLYGGGFVYRDSPYTCVQVFA
jgi:phage-related tail fiber protein